MAKHLTSTLLFALFCFKVTSIISQPLVYSAANAHSHNDYEQPQPFYQAYQQHFGSIEVDIHLFQGKLLVSHDSTQLTESRTLENLYLEPLSQLIQKNGGWAYADSTRRLQLLIDLKTEATPTMESLVAVLNQYPSITRNHLIKIVVSGNMPEEGQFEQYPGYIWFDGRLNRQYTPASLSRIALMSADFGKYIKRKDPAALLPEERAQLASLVQQAHGLQKPIRFWASPDHTQIWQELMDLKVDYINTDRISQLSEFLSLHPNAALLPYNRIIHSAGEVLRFGNPDLENHALDVAVLPLLGKAVIQDRYGLVALDLSNNTFPYRWSYTDMPHYRKYMSVYSGIQTLKENGKTWVLWTAAEKESGNGALMIAEWSDGFQNISSIGFEKISPAANALPNEMAIAREGGVVFIYVVLNGNNELVKIRWSDRNIMWKRATGVAPYGIDLANGKIYVSNWAGAVATDSTRERAGVPWGLAYTDSRTGATSSGTVTVFDAARGNTLHEIQTGLHPNAVKASADGRYVYIANGSSDQITVVHTRTNTVSESIDVGLLKGKNSFQGSTPNALELNSDNTLLYVSNGLDNAVAVVRLGKNAATTGKGKSQVIGYIPTEAYPAGLKIVQNKLVVANLESNGANVINATRKSRSIHHQLASISIIPMPDAAMLQSYTKEVAQLNLVNRAEQLLLPARQNRAPVPVPERIGEPSVFKHVVYIIKENKTYDQVYGDISKGRGDSALCIFGERITPNMHALAKTFGWMDDYYASGKSSAEGHQWTDAGMVSDYVEKNVRAWFRSYPHRQEDAMVYNQSGFIWNHALDHGKTVRVYGEACETEYDRKLKWADLYQQYEQGIRPNWYNKSTIARLLPVISPTFPDCDNMVFSDQQRADVFIQEWKEYEQQQKLPNLMILSLPNDHTAGTSPDFPTTNAMVADNDLAVGRIVEMISKSRYWDSTVIFITQDDSQSGWDHISAYRTIGLAVSPYSKGDLITTHYNQTSMLRTIEQILGIPPMNSIDATAQPMSDCFQLTKQDLTYKALPNNIPLNQMNKPIQSLSGKAKKYALQSQNEVFNEVDGGSDDTMNRIIWFAAKGTARYPGQK